MKIFLIAVLLFFGLFECIAADSLSTTKLSVLAEAMEKYAQAESSLERGEREKLFNESLKIFLDYSRVNPSGKLLYNIGNVYAYLGDYGTAIVFYRRAEKLIPRDRLLKINLEKVIDLAGVKGYQISHPVTEAVTFAWLSAEEKKLILLGLAFFSIILFSLDLWFSLVGFKWFSRISLGCTLLVSMLFIWHHFFIPPTAVVTKASVLRVIQEKRNESKFVLHPGEMVEVLYMDQEKGVLRVKTATDVTGYLSGDSICVI